MEARALQSTGDAQYRSEAAYLATDNLGKMWTYDSEQPDRGLRSDTAGPGTPYRRVQEDGRAAIARRVRQLQHPIRR